MTVNRINFPSFFSQIVNISNQECLSVSYYYNLNIEGKLIIIINRIIIIIITIINRDLGFPVIEGRV